MEEIWATIEPHIKETIMLFQWSQEYYTAEVSIKQILQGWGIRTLPKNNVHPNKMTK